MDRRARPAFVSAFLVLALLARLLTPAGWMPAHDGGGFRLVLCPSAAPMPAAHAGHGAPKQHDQQPDHPCAFASAGVAVAEPRLPDLLPPAILTTVTARPDPTAVAIGRGLAAPPPPPTGPPLRA